MSVREIVHLKLWKAYENRMNPRKCPTSRPFDGLPRMCFERLMVCGQMAQSRVKTHWPPIQAWTPYLQK